MPDPPLHPLGPGVWAAGGDPLIAGPEETAFLERQLPGAPRRRVRICAHPGPGADVHEMLILLAADTYIRPHRHANRAESLHVIAGRADAVFFDERGAVTTVVALGEHGSGMSFFYRIETPQFHTLLLRSERFYFHEATQGPFRPEQTQFAAWAPAEEDTARIAPFLAQLERLVQDFRGGRGRQR